MKVGLQLYTLREETAGDFVGTLQRVADIGYGGVEFAGYGGLEPGRLKQVLDELGLAAIGSHVGLERLRGHLDEEIAMNVAIGSRYVVCPYLSEEDRSEAGLPGTIAVFAEASRRLGEHGIRFGYHNHDFEFTEKIGDKLLFDQIFASMTPEQLQVELDVCWVRHGGYDPVDYIGKYAGRVPLIHLKDLRTLEDGRGQTVILGQGELDLKAVIEAGGKAGVEWFVVEQDECQEPPLASVASSMEWLKRHSDLTLGG